LTFRQGRWHWYCIRKRGSLKKRLQRGITAWLPFTSERHMKLEIRHGKPEEAETAI
jgi:hypothetical protein